MQRVGLNVDLYVPAMQGVQVPSFSVDPLSVGWFLADRLEYA